MLLQLGVSLAIAVGLTQVATFGTTIYLHRCRTHRALRWLALITGGEGFHNNHHGFPRSPKFSVRPGEIDPSWPIIRLLTRMRLARAHQTIEEGGHGLTGEPRHEVST